VHAHVGNGREPVIELAVEIVEIAEAACDEEVLPDVAERTLDLDLGLGAVRPVGPRMDASGRSDRLQTM
jgi:hypothetical protein